MGNSKSNALILDELKGAILNLKLDLQDYEAKYKLASEVFYEQFASGMLDDREDFIIWSGLYEMLLTNETQLQDLI